MYNFGFDFDIDLDKLNSATKYPSIPNYHEIGDKGILIEDKVINFEGQLHVTEKVDGTNARVLCMPDNTFFIGQREELLWYSQDMLYNKSLHIVETIKPFINIISHLVIPNNVIVVFLEVYGGGVGGNKNYTKNKNNRNAVVFDLLALHSVQLKGLMSIPHLSVSKWRDFGGQPFIDYDILNMKIQSLPAKNDLQLEMVPSVDNINGNDLPKTIKGTRDWMYNILPNSKCMIDDTGLGQPEGCVIRTTNRDKIAKLRFKEYNRTVKANNNT